MRFLIAVVTMLVTMTVSFESYSELYRDQQKNLQPAASEEGQGSQILKAPTNGEPAGELTAAANADKSVAERDVATTDFCQALKEAAETSNIPVGFFARLLWQESKFQSNVVSHVGAQGVAQFMPATAAEVGLDDPFDPLKALPASAKLLRRLHNQFGNLGLAAAAYNAGSGRIQKWLERRGALPQETRDYVRIITGNVAEKWLQESKTLNLSIQLPRGAPCEGVGGLTAKQWADVVPVSLAPFTSDAIRKAEARAAAQRQAAFKSGASKSAKARLALSLKESKTASLTNYKAKFPKPDRSRNVRMASATGRL